MNLLGKAHKYGDNINTDLIIAGKYTKTLNMQDIAAHCMEDLDPNFIKKVRKGDFLVAGYNFGCGSSREQASLALKHAGIGAVLAKSFARIFYRNAINVGLPAIVCDTASIQDRDMIAVDQDKGELIVNGFRAISYEKLPTTMRDILEHGGLASYLREEGDYVL